MEKMIELYNYIKQHGPCTSGEALEAIGLNPKSGSLFAGLSKSNHIVCVSRKRPAYGKAMVSVWAINPEVPPPVFTKIEAKSKTSTPSVALEVDDRTTLARNRFHYGQVVVTPAGKGVVTSQQGDRVIVKMKGCYRQAFPLTQCSVA